MGGIAERRYWDVWDHVEPLAGESEDDDRRAGPRRTAQVRAASEDQRCAGRCLPVGWHRLEHERRAVLRRRARTGARRFPLATTATTTSYPTNCTTRARWRPQVGADHHETRSRADDVVDFLPEMVASAGRANRRSGLCAASTTSPNSRATMASSCARSVKAPMSCSSAIRAGLPRSSAAVERLAGSEFGQTARRCRSVGARLRPDRPPRVAAARCPHEPLFWSGAEAFTRRRKAPLAVAAPPPGPARLHFLRSDGSRSANAFANALRNNRT